jgi:hypothetical protein
MGDPATSLGHMEVVSHLHFGQGGGLATPKASFGVAEPPQAKWG